MKKNSKNQKPLATESLACLLFSAGKKKKERTFRTSLKTSRQKLLSMRELGQRGGLVLKLFLIELREEKSLDIFSIVKSQKFPLTIRRQSVLFPPGVS